MNIDKDKIVAEISAGAVVYRIMNNQPHFAIIHRNKMNDYALPKGHCDPGESLQDTVRREVLEETGWSVVLTDYVKRTEYEARDEKTSTLYMRNVYWFLAEGINESQHIHDPEEVDSLQWLEGVAAEARLSYEEERDVIRTAQQLLRQKTIKH